MGTSSDASSPAVEHFLAATHTNGYAYYCGHCGKVWARLRTVGNSYYSPFTQSCKQHWREGDAGITGLWPGSLLAPVMFNLGEFYGEAGFPYLLGRLTPAHLTYEFTLALDWAEEREAKWQKLQLVTAAFPGLTSLLKE